MTIKENNLKIVSLENSVNEIQNKKFLKLLYSDKHFVIAESIISIGSDNVLGKLSNNLFCVLGCRQGVMKIIQNDRCVVLRPGHAVFLFPGVTVMSIHASGNCRGIGLGVSTDISSLAFNKSNDVKSVIRWLHKNQVIKINNRSMSLLESYQVIIKAKLECQDRRFFDKSISHILCSCIYDIIADVDTDDSLVNEMNGGQRERLFSKFIDMLSNMEVVEHGLSYYADKLYVTPKYLSTVCKQLSGRTALSWVNEKLIDSVRYHLEYTDLSAKEICHKLGFSSISFFGKYVKRHLGASPNEYRKRL